MTETGPVTSAQILSAVQRIEGELTQGFKALRDELRDIRVVLLTVADDQARQSSRQMELAERNGERFVKLEARIAALSANGHGAE